MARVKAYNDTVSAISFAVTDRATSSIIIWNTMAYSSTFSVYANLALFIHELIEIVDGTMYPRIRVTAENKNDIVDAMENNSWNILSMGKNFVTAPGIFHAIRIYVTFRTQFLRDSLAPQTTVLTTIVASALASATGSAISAATGIGTVAYNTANAAITGNK
jgi:hypothetical protein